jgi:hypothetical protein
VLVTARVVAASSLESEHAATLTATSVAITAATDDLQKVTLGG